MSEDHYTSEFFVCDHLVEGFKLTGVDAKQRGECLVVGLLCGVYVSQGTHVGLVREGGTVNCNWCEELVKP